MTTRLPSAQRVSFLLLFFLSVSSTIIQAQTLIYVDDTASGTPTGPEDPSLRSQINGTQLTFSYRNNASDVFVQFKKSDDLQTWNEMIEGLDFDYATSPGEVINGVQTLVTLDLLTTEPTLVFHEEFSGISP